MKSLWTLALVMGVAMSSAAWADPVQLDISDGFNMDCIVGPLEFQAVRTYNADNDPDSKLLYLQGGLDDGVCWYSHWGGLRLMCCASTAAGYGQPYSIDGMGGHPVYVPDGEGLPENGTIAGTDRTYHMASNAGNATFSGNWIEVADVGTSWGVKNNAMVVGCTDDTADWQIAEAVAVLPEGQRAEYSDINFVLAALDRGERAMNMEIYALYGDGSDEQRLYAFSTEAGGSGPKTRDVTNSVATPDFVSVYAFGSGYDDYPPGSIRGDRGGDLYEFEVALTLDDAKTLYGIKVVDVNPALKWKDRGVAIYAATADPIPEPATMALLGLGILGLVLRRRR